MFGLLEKFVWFKRFGKKESRRSQIRLRILSMERDVVPGITEMSYTEEFPRCSNRVRKARFNNPQPWINPKTLGILRFEHLSSPTADRISLMREGQLVTIRYKENPKTGLWWLYEAAIHNSGFHDSSPSYEDWVS